VWGQWLNITPRIMLVYNRRARCRLRRATAVVCASFFLVCQVFVRSGNLLEKRSPLVTDAIRMQLSNELQVGCLYCTFCGSWWNAQNLVVVNVRHRSKTLLLESGAPASWRAAWFIRS